MAERRRFSRIIYQVPATITQGQRTVSASIQDLSLQGLLLKAQGADAQLSLEETAIIQFSLPDSDVSIELAANLISVEGDVIRAQIDHIDIESIGHLKRLVELNVGDDSLLHRELEHLSDLGKHT